MYSFVIKIAIDVKKDVELVDAIPMPGIVNDIVEEVFADSDLDKISIEINNTIFFFKDLCFFL